MRNKPLKEIAAVLGLSSDKTERVSHFAIDSRLIEAGGLFFALPGEKMDGHDFIEEIARKGAITAVVSRKYVGPDFGLELLRVEDVLEALHLLAKVAFSKRSEQVVGITGSMGKTTTKEFLATLLSARFRVAKTPGNYNTQLTFPLNLLNLEGEYDVLVLEMGMSAKGQIAKLVQIAPPDIAILTRIAPAGIPGLVGGLEAIAEAKAEIFSHPKTHLGILSCQAARFAKALYAGTMKKWIYGWKSDFEDYKMGDLVMEEVDGGVVIGDSPVITLPMEATHLRENFLAAVAGARALGLSWSDIQEKAKELKPFKQRFETIKRDGVTFIQDCYNANPDSVMAALTNLPKAKGKRIAVLGEMAELGEEAAKYHREVGVFASKHLDRVFCIGEEAKHLADAFSNRGKEAAHFNELAKIKEELFALVQPGDVVLVKGANSLKLWQLLEE